MKKKKRASLERKMSVHGYVFTLPLMVGFFLIFIPILFNSLNFSFGEIDMSGAVYKVNHTGFDNYYHVLRVEPNYLRSLTDTVINMVTDIPIIIFFSLFIATLLNQKIKGKTFFRVIFFLPVVMATGIIAKAELNNYMISSLSNTSAIDIGAGGASSGVMTQLSGLQKHLEGMSMDPKITSYITGAVQNIYSIVNRSGVQILMFLSGYQSVSPSVYEAAKVEGASGWQSFWKITLPILSPVVFVNIIYTIIDSFTRAENPIMEMISNAAFKNNRYGWASSMAWVYMIVIFVVVGIISIIFSKFVFYEKR